MSLILFNKNTTLSPGQGGKPIGLTLLFTMLEGIGVPKQARTWTFLPKATRANILAFQNGSAIYLQSGKRLLTHRSFATWRNLEKTL